MVIKFNRHFRPTRQDPRDDVLFSAMTGAEKEAVLRAESEQRLNITLIPEPPSTPFDLDKKQFPWLTSLGRNLTALAHLGQLDEVIGREAELSQLVDVLGKRRSNNPCLVGNPGVGKTAIVEGLAIKMARQDKDVLPLHNRAIIELEMSKIMAGTALRGSFSERLQGLKKEMERAHGRVIAFIDEIHTLMSSSNMADGAQDAAGELKSALARGTFPCIGSTTFREYHKYIVPDAALERRFCKVIVDEPSEETALQMLKQSTLPFSQFHQIAIEEEALVAAVQLSNRYMAHQHLPGKAVDLLDLAMSRAKRHGLMQLTRQTVAEACAEFTGVPLEQLQLEPAARLLHMQAYLNEQVVGHEKVIEGVTQALQRGYAGFFSNKPLASFLFYGPMQTGKHHLAKVIAEFLFGSTQALLRLDMREYTESHSVSRLIGAPPGYIGHENGGILTDRLRRRPHCVLVFENADMAHPDVLALLGQLLQEGFITSNQGEHITCQHAVVILLVHTETRALVQDKTVGFVKSQKKHNQNHLLPQISHLLTSQLCFEPFSEQNLRQLAIRWLDTALSHLHTTRGIKLQYDASVVDFLLACAGGTSSTQAIRRNLEGALEQYVSQLVLSGKLIPGQLVKLAYIEGHFFVTPLRV